MDAWILVGSLYKDARTLVSMHLVDGKAVGGVGQTGLDWWVVCKVWTNWGLGISSRLSAKLYEVGGTMGGAS